MKPNTKSPYFIGSIVSFALYLIQLFVLRVYVFHIVTTTQAENAPISSLLLSAHVWIGVSALLWYKSSRFHAPLALQLVAFFIVPFALTPLLVIIDVAIVLFPFYDIVSGTVQ